MSSSTRRAFLQRSAAPLLLSRHLAAQEAGARPPAPPAGVEVLNPRERVPVAWIIDDSTCLVNLIRFAIPQLAATFPDQYRQDWRSMPYEIPDTFVRRFAEWAQREGVKGKYSVVPFPSCVGRVDTELPGWTPKQVSESIELVRREIAPNWDIHPEMVTHTRIIDLKTGHPVAPRDAAWMENWDWCAGRSADEIGSYIAYALQILKNVGLHCDGVTTPGGFGKGALHELPRAVFQAVRSVYGSEIPHYFRNLFDKGSDSVAPRVEFASRLASSTPECVVSIYACTGDWTGNWDSSLQPDVDRFIGRDLSSGRVVEVIDRGEPAVMLCHWNGIYYNGQELGFRAMQAIVRRINTRYKQVLWMKLADLARYWAAKELTTIQAPSAGRMRLDAPYACPDFTLSWQNSSPPALVQNGKATPLREVRGWQELEPGAWRREGDRCILCINLPKGPVEIQSVA